MKEHSQPAMISRSEPGHTHSAPAWSFAKGNLLLGIWSLLLLGLALTGIGVLIASQQNTATGRVVAALASSVAGGLIGAVSTIIVSGRAESTALAEVREMLSATTASNFFSRDLLLNPLRRPWHHYRITQVDGIPVWRYCVYHFEQASSIGTIATTVDYINPRGLDKHTYSVEAGVRGSRLIMIDRRLEGEEAPIIQVYPDMLRGFQSIHCGVVFVQTWDGNHVITPGILSDSPLIGTLTEGTVQSADDGKLLNEQWQRHFFTDNSSFLLDRLP